MAKAKRANHRSGDDVGVDQPAEPVQNGQNFNGRNGTDVRAVPAAQNGVTTAQNGVPGAQSGVPGAQSDVSNAQNDVPDAQNGVSASQHGVIVAQDSEPNPAAFGTPVRVDQIALAAMALSDDLLAATKGLPESIESRQFRRDLDEAADTFRNVASELETTAGNLIRLAATEGQSCGVTWGICADHGLTLMNVGEVVTCHVLGCHREQEAVVERCTQPVAYRVVDVAGPALLTCAGHAIACRLHLDGAVITLASDSLELL